ncbi:TPA: hypothetical protein ACHUSL_004174, partial [Shigella flexneri]
KVYNIKYHMGNGFRESESTASRKFKICFFFPPWAASFSYRGIYESNNIRTVRSNGECIDQNAEALAKKTINRSPFAIYPTRYSPIILGARMQRMVVQNRTIIITHHILR